MSAALTLPGVQARRVLLRGSVPAVMAAAAVTPMAAIAAMAAVWGMTEAVMMAAVIGNANRPVIWPGALIVRSAAEVARAARRRHRRDASQRARRCA